MNKQFTQCSTMQQSAPLNGLQQGSAIDKLQIISS